MTYDSFLLLFHLSYYSVSYYIQLLRIKLTSMEKNPSDLYWKGIKNVLLQLHQVLTVFQLIFSVPVLFIITTKFTFASFGSFEIIYSLIKPNSYFTVSWFIRHLLNFFRFLVYILIILHASDMPVQQVYSNKILTIRSQLT